MKKIIALLLCLIILVTGAACDNTISQNSSNSDSQTVDNNDCYESNNITEPPKPSPISITYHAYDIDSVGGVEWETQIKNNTASTIKYVTLKWTCYNAVNDIIYDEISARSYVKIRCTGPIDGETTKVFRNSTKFYNYTYDHSVFNEIIVEFMDGNIVTITDQEYYDILKKTEIKLPVCPFDIYTSSNEKYYSFTKFNAEICTLDKHGFNDDVWITLFRGSYVNSDDTDGKIIIRLVDSKGNIVYVWKFDELGTYQSAHNCIEAGETYSFEFVYVEE